MASPTFEPVHRRLAAARLYLCTDARRGRGDLESFLHAALSGGVDIVQLRDKTLTARDELQVQSVVARVAADYGTLVAVNDRADMAQLVAATVFHTGQLDLPTSASRQLLGPGVILGRSTHTLEQARIAERDPNVGYFCVGPVWPTPTKEGRPGIGVNAVQAVAQTHPAKPWFAIGGINETSLELVLQAGAQRVVVVRAITEAADPFQASRRLKTRLSSAVSTRQ